MIARVGLLVAVFAALHLGGQSASAQTVTCYSGTVTAGGPNGGFTGFWKGNIGSINPTTCTLADGTTVREVVQVMYNGVILRLAMAAEDHPTTHPAAEDFPETLTTTVGSVSVTWGSPSTREIVGQGAKRDYTAASQTGGSSLTNAANTVFSSGNSITVSWTGSAPPPPALTDPPAPVNFRTSSIADTAIGLAWDAVSGAASYRITTSGVGTLATVSTTVTVSALTACTPYTFTVEAYGDGTAYNAVYGTAAQAMGTTTGCVQPQPPSPARTPVNPLPLKEDPNPWVEKLCWRLPACPLSIVFLSPLIAMGAVIQAGSRNPALIGLAGGAAFAGFMILLDPNPFAFFTMGLVVLASFLIWRLART